MARSRGSGVSAGYSCGTARRAMNRWFVRSVRRATGDSPGAHRANRSITDGWNTTSGTRSRPSARPRSQPASRPPTAGSSPAPGRRRGQRHHLPGERRRLRRHRRRPPPPDIGGNISICHTALILNAMRETGDPGCDNDNVSPTPAQQAQAARIAAELAALGFALPGTLADRMTRCGHVELPLPRRPAPPARPLPPVDPQERRQDRHPHPDRRPARRLRPLVRQPPPAPRTRRRTRNPQPRHRRSRPPLEPLARPPGTGTAPASPQNRNDGLQIAWAAPA